MKKKIYVLLLSIFIILNSTGIVYASEEYRELAYTMERVSNFLVKTGYIPTNSIMLSNPIELNGSGHTIAQNIYYVFDGDKIIGQIIVSEIGGLFSSTFSYTVYSEIQCAYEQKYPITLYGLEGCLIAEIDNTVYVLENVDNKDISTLVRQRDILGNAIIKKVTLIEMPIGSRSTYHFLRVANVGNEVSPQGIQICWAACMASKVMYQTNYRNLTAMSVFDKCWESVDDSPYDIPYGVDSWYNSAAALYGISLRIQDSLGSKETTSNALKNGKPIILSVTDDSISHAIVLCGIDEDASYMEFILMDPDASGYVYLSLPNNIFSNASQFCYAASYGRTYTKVTKFRY